MNPKEFVIFKVTAIKKSDKWPDYVIKAKDENGNFVKIGAGWKRNMKNKVDQNGNPVTFIACKLEEPQAKLTPEQIKEIQDARNAELAKQNKGDDIDSELIPF